MYDTDINDTLPYIKIALDAIKGRKASEVFKAFFKQEDVIQKL